jgi:hypothetical protein
VLFRSGEILARILVQVWRNNGNTTLCDVTDYIKLRSQMVNFLINNSYLVAYC